MTRRAIFAAQQVNAPESLYRWEWQTGTFADENREPLTMPLAHTGAPCGRFSRSDPNSRSAMELHKHRSVRPWGRYTSSWWIFFYNVPRRCRIAEQVGAYLIEAREYGGIIQSGRVAGLLSRRLRRYCAVERSPSSTPWPTPTASRLSDPPAGSNRVAGQFADRAEARISVPVGAETLTQEVRQFRRRLEKRTTREYLPHAQKLYDWLIRPLESDLVRFAHRYPGIRSGRSAANDSDGSPARREAISDS